MITDISDPIADVFLRLGVKDKIRMLQTNKTIAQSIASALGGKGAVESIILREKDAYVERTDRLNELLNEDPIPWDTIRTILKEDVNTRGVYLLACRDGQLDIVKDMLRRSINKQERTSYGTNAIVATIQGYNQNRDARLYESVLSTLLQNGVSVTTEDKAGNTPLHYVCQFGTVDMVRMLLSQGANINKKNVHGQTPLFSAYEWSNDAVIRFLLQRGADPTIKDKYGSTADYYYHAII